MKLKNAVMALTLVVGAVFGIGDAKAGFISTQKAVEPGVWTSDFNGAKEYAEKNGIPMFVFWANTGCSHCEGVEKEMNKDLFKTWMADRQLLLVFSEANASVKSWIKANSKTTIKAYPFAAVYWPKSSGDTVLEGFSAYKGNMAQFGANSKDSNVQQIMDSIDFLLPGWDPSGIVDPIDPVDPDPVDPVHTHVWSGWVVTTPATCETAGVEMRTCSAAGCAKAQESRTIKALGHDWGAWTTVTPADIGVAGTKERVCRRCKAAEQGVIPAIDPRKEVDPTVFFKRAKTVEGVAYHNGDLFGKVAITIGKYSTKKQNLSVKVKIASFGGKTYTKTVNKVTPDSYGDILGMEVPFGSTIGKMVIDLVNGEEEYEIYGESEEYSVENGDVVIGGKLESEEMTFSVDLGELEPENEEYDFIIDAPSFVGCTVRNGTSLNFGSAPKIKYVKYSEDGDRWYELGEYDEERYPNANAVKLTYKYSTGAFSGSFKIYASNESSIDYGKKPKLKTYTAKVSGYVVNGTGVGTVSVKVGKKTYVGTCTLD